MWAHPLTLLVVVVVGCAVASALFGLLKALRGPIGLLAYGGLILTLYAYYRIGDRYFAEGIWQISLACLVIMWVTLKRVPLLRVVLLAAVVEFGSRINRTGYPQQTVLALGLAGVMIAVATFWTGKYPQSSARPPEDVPFGYPRGPQSFSPYARQKARKRRSGWEMASALWRKARG